MQILFSHFFVIYMICQFFTAADSKKQDIEVQKINI